MPDYPGSRWPPPLSFLPPAHGRYAIGAAMVTLSSSSERSATCTQPAAESWRPASARPLRRSIGDYGDYDDFP
jgi:hypothetical protein